MATEPQPTSIDAVVDRLTTEEKLALIHGSVSEGDAATGYLPPIERVGVDSIRMTDGPMGVRADGATLFPATPALAASFDTGLARRFGEAVGAEARGRGFDVLLMPGCNLIRVPHCGRNFEYFSEDPTHNAAITASVTRGAQSAGVVATPKHYVANNQERYRTTGSAEVSERPLRELYLPAFEKAVTEADAGAIMSAYNRIDGTYAAQHEHLLTDVLKGEFDFDGPVLSDWWGTYDGVAAARGGLDLEMPGAAMLSFAAQMAAPAGYLKWLDDRWPDGVFGPNELFNRLTMAGQGDEGGFPSSAGESLFAADLPDAIERGHVPEERLDDMVRRVLTIHERVGALRGDRDSNDSTETTPADNRDLAREIAVRGSVLLENEGVLPLSENASVAVIGPNADEAKLGGGGEGMVSHPATVSPLEGIRNRADGRVGFARGHPPIETPTFFDAGVDLGSLLPFDGEDPRPQDAAVAAAQADVAVVVLQDYATEGEDRDSLALPGAQDTLVSTVAAAAEETVVVLQTAGPVEMPWLEEVDAVLEVWYPGQEGGDAIAQVLYGDADPGGRLPMTFAAAEGDYPANSRAKYPGIEGVDGYPEIRYDEGVFVGYRHFDERDLEPLFPFGHGHSYAEFTFDDLAIDDEAPPLTASVTVGNVADREGREVVQAYVAEADPSVPRPPRELGGFRALHLDAGEQGTVEIELDERAFSYYDEAKGWTVDGGEYAIEVGRSSRDRRCSTTVDLP